MTSTPEVFHKPWPDRILEDIGFGFFTGSYFGGLYHFVKGIHNSPHSQRLFNGLTAVRMNAPCLGGEFAVWCGVLSAGECTMLYIRQKEDPWYFIIAGAFTGGLLAGRNGNGFSSRTSGAVSLGCFFALLEGAKIMLTRSLSKKPLPLVILDDGAPLAKFGDDSGKSWSFFDSTEGLESFDSPKPPSSGFLAS